MDWRSLPPLSALRAFSAYAETRSIAKAGAALNVSHAAISQQLRSLESHLGTPLLDRSGRQMQLTSEGAALALSLQEAFGAISLTVEAITGADAMRPLRIACTPSFASAWLMPRLASFRAEHTGIEMMIDANPALTDPTPGGIDIAIRYGEGPWPGLDMDRLIAAPIVVVGSPALFPDGPPASRDALADLPWLQELGTSEATRWLHDQGVAREATNILHVPGNLMLDGARSGQGLAFTTRLAVADDIVAGRLLVLFEEDGDTGYNIVTRPGPQRAPLRAFVRWLKREAVKHPLPVMT